MSGARDPQSQIGQHDVVLATARCAMEAILSGAYTILFERGLCGGAVTVENVPHFLQWNFGRGLLNETLTYRHFNELIRGYSADAAFEAARLLRPLVEPDSIAASFESLYRRCVSIRAARSLPGSSLQEKLTFARNLSQAMARQPQRFPSSRRFFRNSPSAKSDPARSLRA